MIASAKEIDALNITLFNSCINFTNVHLCNYCTKIFVIVVNTCVCRRSVDNKAVILSYPILSSAASFKTVKSCRTDRSTGSFCYNFSCQFWHIRCSVLRHTNNSKAISSSLPISRNLYQIILQRRSSEKAPGILPHKNDQFLAVVSFSLHFYLFSNRLQELEQ